MSADQPVKVEHNADDQGHEYETHWYTDPPPPEQPFTVTRDEWSGDAKVHRIYEIRLIP